MTATVYIAGGPASGVLASGVEPASGAASSLASLRGVVTANSPIIERKRAWTLFQWKLPPKLTCSIWNSPERNSSVEPTIV